jgi:hypothetical protein
MRFTAGMTNGETFLSSSILIIDKKDTEILVWLEGADGKLELDHCFDSPKGIAVSRGATKANAVNGARIVLVRDSTTKEGYGILTGFPQP